MNEKENLSALSEKYKQEMMRLYGKAIKSAAAPSAVQAPTTPPSVSQTSPPISQKPTPAQEHQAEENQSQTVISEPSKFPSAEEIIMSEKAEQDAENHMRENYDFTPSEEKEIVPYGEIPTPQPDSVLETLYKGNNSPQPPMTDVGYFQAEVSTANKAYPIANAFVIITRQNGGKNELVRMLITDENGMTETIALPAPSISYSETPGNSEKPFADYQVSVYAKGFYTIPEITVPVFSTVKSIQPISMIPLASFEQRGSTLNGGKGE